MAEKPNNPQPEPIPHDPIAGHGPSGPIRPPLSRPAAVAFMGDLAAKRERRDIPSDPLIALGWELLEDLSLSGEQGGTAERPLVVIPQPRIEIPAPPKIVGPGGIPSRGTAMLDRWGDFDFIREYTAWADVVEIPRQVHTAVAIQLIASVLNYNGVTIRHSNYIYPMDLWQLILTPSGGGRSEMIRGVKRLLRAAQLQDLFKDSDWSSIPAMQQHFAENPYSLLFWSEFSELLQFFNEQRNGKRWFTDRYDDTEPPDNRKYRVTGRPDKDTPPITFTCPPRINILAASSDGWFFEDMQTSDSSGGFIPRWMIIRSGKLGAISTPPPYDEAKQAELLERLRWIATIKGEADISGILPEYDDDAWYKPTLKRFEEASPNLGRIYFSRHRGLAFKIALIYEVSRSGSLKVSSESWKHAKATARLLEDILFELLDTGMNQRGWEISQVEEYIYKAGRDGVARRDLGRSLRSIDDLHKFVDSLERDHVIYKKVIPTAGRSKELYIHSDHLGSGSVAQGRQAQETPVVPVPTPEEQARTQAEYAQYRQWLKANRIEPVDLSFAEWRDR